MKKLSLLIVSFIFAISLMACSTSNIDTNVRVKSISYTNNESSNVNVSFKSLIQLSSSKRIVNETPAYVFPNDVLTFTIELEDPNFEFISLLSITFNNQVIRANVNNSIFETRDCGLNICVDFPFFINENVKTYTVNEVKFAKLRSDSGVSALIDRNSVNTITLDIYNEEVFPYVLESIETLNLRIKSLKYFIDGDTVEDKYNPNKAGYMDRGFYVINYPRNTPAFAKIITQNDVFALNNMNSSQIEQISYDNWNYNYDDNEQHDTFSQHLVVSYIGQEYDISTGYYYIYFAFFESIYSDVFFYNEGNNIFVDILGNKFLFIEIVNGMRIIPFVEDLNDYTPDIIQ